MKTHFITTHSKETGEHPCGQRNPSSTTTHLGEVTCLLCLRWAEGVAHSRAQREREAAR